MGIPRTVGINYLLVHFSLQKILLNPPRPPKPVYMTFMSFTERLTQGHEKLAEK